MTAAVQVLSHPQRPDLHPVLSCICTGGPLPTEIQNPGNLQVDAPGIACTSLPSEELWKHLLSHLMMLME
jgi:hypothetical protein